jgi:hypothetical protein
MSFVYWMSGAACSSHGSELLHAIDVRVVHDAVKHYMCPHNCTGER